MAAPKYTYDELFDSSDSDGDVDPGKRARRTQALVKLESGAASADAVRADCRAVLNRSPTTSEAELYAEDPEGFAEAMAEDESEGEPPEFWGA